MAVYTVSITDGTTLSSLAVSAGRGPKGDGFTGGSYNSSTGVVTFTSNENLGFSTDDLRSFTGGSYNSTTGEVTFTSNTGVGFTTGDIRGGSIDETLGQIAASKAETAVDVFVYDTSRDSDGGAWRKRTQHTSWYNETLNTSTRGSRREFPAVAVIVIAGGGNPKVTIYDGDDPSLPLWRECSAGIPNFSGTVVSSVKMLNGKLFLGVSVNYAGYLLLDFPSDYWAWNGAGQGNNGNGKFVGVIANPLLDDPGVQPTDTQGTTYTSGVYTYPSLISFTINDVAMTVLPDSPIDPATGLPVPTIACLVGETEVLVADGSTKRLDQVQPGEMVKTLEGEHKVLNWWDQGIKDVIELEFDGGQKLICTTDHKIRTTEGWVEAGDLTEDHEVISA